MNIISEPVVRIVARPRAVAHHIAPAAGPFTIRAEQPVLVSQASEIPIPATPALVPATRTSLLPAVSGPALLPVNAEPSVFQTADGRVFAFSNGVNAIQPGKLPGNSISQGPTKSSSTNPKLKILTDSQDNYFNLPTAEFSLPPLVTKR